MQLYSHIITLRGSIFLPLYQEIHYGNEGARSTVYNKPPRPPPTSVPPVTSRGPGRIQRDKKSASSSDLVSFDNPKRLYY